MTNLMSNLTMVNTSDTLANPDEPRFGICKDAHYVDYSNKSQIDLEEFATQIEQICEARTKSYFPDESTRRLVRVTFLPKIGSLPIIKGIACMYGLNIKPVIDKASTYFFVCIDKSQEIPPSVFKNSRHILLREDLKLIIEGADSGSTEKDIEQVKKAYNSNRICFMKNQ